VLPACPSVVRIHSSANKFVTVYFFLLVLGFCLVARRKARTPITPAGNPPLRANVTVTRPPWLPQWLSDIHKLWARWLSNNSQPSSSPPHPPSTRRQKSPLSGATSSFEMSRISNASIQAGQPGDGNTMSGQRGHVEAVADTPDPGSGDTLSTCK